jgi:hypothetical protein
MSALCEAVRPMAGFGLTWIACLKPATERHRYGCVHEHIVERSNCVDHQPEPGAVGCRQCFELGHECELRLLA